MKKILRRMLCTFVSCAVMGSACAEGVLFAARAFEPAQFAHLPSYMQDEQTGKWSVQPYQADALVDRFWTFGMKNSARTVVFHLAAEGDARTGVWTPVLRFYHIDGETINARAVSVMLDDVRYDLAASSQEIRNGRYTAECITVPLNAEAMALIDLILSAQSVAVRMIGEKVHTVQLDPTLTGSRAVLEVESLAQLQSGADLLKALGADSYALWDLSAQAWEREYGYRPAVTQTKVEAIEGQKDTLGMILPDASGTAVTQAQEVLAAYGFLSGTPAKTFDANAVNAVLRAQNYLGRVATGCYDSALAAALEEGRKAQPEKEYDRKPLGNVAKVAVDRFWFADAVSASADPDAVRSVANKDNVLLIADGLISNLSAEEMHLFMQLKAEVVYNGTYAYKAELVCECSGGTQLDVRLLPLGEARLIVYAEIPAQLAADEQAQWNIVLEADGEQLVIALQ